MENETRINIENYRRLCLLNLKQLWKELNFLFVTENKYETKQKMKQNIKKTISDVL